jgi:hypothetical protein
MFGFVNILLGGIAYGFVLFLMAGGLSITLGLMGSPTWLTLPWQRSAAIRLRC